MKKVVTSEELTKTARRVAQTKRLKSLQQRKDFVMNELQDCPPLLCLNELANKTRLSLVLASKLFSAIVITLSRAVGEYAFSLLLKSCFLCFVPLHIEGLPRCFVSNVSPLSCYVIWVYVLSLD